MNTNSQIHVAIRDQLPHANATSMVLYYFKRFGRAETYKIQNKRYYYSYVVVVVVVTRVISVTIGPSCPFLRLICRR